MIDSRNFGSVTGRLVADPEVVETKGAKIIKFRIACDFAGSENGKSASGFFDVVHFVSDNMASKFIDSQVSAGNISKGTALAVLYRLNHSRWERDATKGQRVELIAEAANYVGGTKPTDSAEPDTDKKEAVTVPAKW